MLITLAEFDRGTNILFTILMVIFLAGASAFLVIRAIRDSRKYRDSVASQGVLSLDAFKQVVERAIRASTRKNRFFIFQVDFLDYDKMLKLLGEEQIKSMIKEQCLVLQKLQPWGIKIGLRDQDSVLILMKANEQLNVESLCQLIINSIAKTYVISVDMSVDLEINVAVESYPEGGANAEEMLNNIDICMVQAKRKGENKYAVFSPQFANVNTDEYKYYQEIKEAIKAKEFILYYQPIVDTNTYEVNSAETLIRWSHRTKGVLPPSSFLYVMEQTGDINWVGLWCFNNITVQAKTWQSNYEQRFTIGINLSERQLVNPELAEELKKIVRKVKVEPKDFVIEISEIMLYKSNPIVKSNMDALHSTGFRICLDGFGANFASPTVLEQLPVDSIKIEKDFWNKLKNSHMVQNIIGLLSEYAQEKSVQLIALGVEDKDEIAMLRNAGINYMQGYVFSKPKDAKDFIGDVVLTPWSDELK